MQKASSTYLTPSWSYLDAILAPLRAILGSGGRICDAGYQTVHMRCAKPKRERSVDSKM